jgi:hypothetical protein
MLVQIILCIALPMIIFTILAVATCFGLRFLKAGRNASADVEHGGLVKTSSRKDSDGGSEESDYVMTPARSAHGAQALRAAHLSWFSFRG